MEMVLQKILKIVFGRKGDAGINDLIPHLLDLNDYLFKIIPKYSKLSVK